MSDHEVCAKRESLLMLEIRKLRLELSQLKQSHEAMVEALKQYANHDQWSKIVPDSYMGEVNVFDWQGDLANEPWEFAEKALATRILDEQKKGGE